MPSGSRKKNCGGIGSSTVTSGEASPGLDVPARPIVASTSTPRLRSASWSATMSVEANAHSACSPAAEAPSVGGTSAIAIADPGGATSTQRCEPPYGQSPRFSKPSLST